MDIWLSKEELAKLADQDRLKQCLVRMNGCRFVAAAQDVKHIIDALELNGDYCRDVSIYQPSAGRIMGQADLLTLGKHEALTREREKARQATAIARWRSQMPR